MQLTVELEPSQPTEAEAAEAFAAQEAIKATMRAARELWIDLAEKIYNFSEAKGWRALGYRSFEQWLADPEIDLNRRNAFYLIESHRELVVRRKVDPKQLAGLEVSKVREVIPAIRRGAVDVEDALEDVRVLSRDDLRQRYSGIGANGAGPVGAEPLDADTEPEWAVCQSCGTRYRRKARAA